MAKDGEKKRQKIRLRRWERKVIKAAARIDRNEGKDIESEIESFQKEKGQMEGAKEYIKEVRSVHGRPA